MSKFFDSRDFKYTCNRFLIDFPDRYDDLNNPSNARDNWNTAQTSAEKFKGCVANFVASLPSKKVDDVVPVYPYLQDWERSQVNERFLQGIKSLTETITKGQAKVQEELRLVAESKTRMSGAAQASRVAEAETRKWIQDINEQLAAAPGRAAAEMRRLDASLRGTTVEEDEAKARRATEFYDYIAKAEADPNSDLNRDKRARDKEQADSARRAESDRAARAATLAAAAAEKTAAGPTTAADALTQANSEAAAKKKTDAAIAQAKQEQERQRTLQDKQDLDARNEAERKRVAAAEAARLKAEAEAVKLAEKQAEKQASEQYLKSVAAGTRLVATSCLGGEGKYYATGTRPRIKPEVVGCVDIHYRAYCPGSAQFIEGKATNFVGMAGCFGDTYDINPKPACKVDDVRIEIVEARACG